MCIPYVKDTQLNLLLLTKEGYTIAKWKLNILKQFAFRITRFIDFPINLATLPTPSQVESCNISLWYLFWILNLCLWIYVYSLLIVGCLIGWEGYNNQNRLNTQQIHELHSIVLKAEVCRISFYFLSDYQTE